LSDPQGVDKYLNLLIYIRLNISLVFEVSITESLFTQIILLSVLDQLISDLF